MLACPSMLAELLAAASIAVGSMTAKTMTPPRPGGMVVAKDKLALGRLFDLLTGIAARMREASTPDDVPWLVSSKVFDPEVYRNYRFRDRPMVNTHWELVLNMRDEQVNKDVDLASLTDIRVLVYYTDFTSL